MDRNPASERGRRGGTSLGQGFSFNPRGLTDRNSVPDWALCMANVEHCPFN